MAKSVIDNNQYFMDLPEERGDIVKLISEQALIVRQSSVLRNWFIGRAIVHLTKLAAEDPDASPGKLRTLQAKAIKDVAEATKMDVRSIQNYVVIYERWPDEKSFTELKLSVEAGATLGVVIEVARLREGDNVSRVMKLITDGTDSEKVMTKVSELKAKEKKATGRTPPKGKNIPTGPEMPVPGVKSPSHYFAKLNAKFSKIHQILFEEFASMQAMTDLVNNAKAYPEDVFKRDVEPSMLAMEKTMQDVGNALARLWSLEFGVDAATKVFPQFMVSTVQEKKDKKK